MLITSAANEHVKWARRVRDGKEPTLIFVEGEQLSRECLHSETKLLAAFYRENSEPKLRALLRLARGELGEGRLKRHLKAEPAGSDPSRAEPWHVETASSSRVEHPH